MRMFLFIVQFPFHLMIASSERKKLHIQREGSRILREGNDTVPSLFTNTFDIQDKGRFLLPSMNKIMVQQRRFVHVYMFFVCLNKCK